MFAFMFANLSSFRLVTTTASYIRHRYRYWSNRGVPTPPPKFPFGNILATVFRNPEERELDWQRQYGKFYGQYSVMQPTLTIPDPDLIKQVLVRDFHLFVNRIKLNPFHEIWSRTLFFVEDEDWKRQVKLKKIADNNDFLLLTSSGFVQ